MSVIKYKEQLYAAVESLLWRQWAELGVAAYAERGTSAHVLDPDALLLFTSVFGRYNQRLYDLVAQWLEQYGRLINPTRIKALQKKTAVYDSSALGYWAALCVRGGDTRWKYLADAGVQRSATPRPLFVDALDGSAPYYREHDTLALQYGWQRNPYISTKKCLTHLPESPATLLLRLRSMMGSTARAEIILLLMEGACSLPQLAQRSAFARSSVKAVIDELLLGNTITEIRAGGRASSYLLAERDAFNTAFHVEQLSFPCWFAIYDAIGALWQLLQYPKWGSLSEATFQGEYAHLLQSYIRPRLLHGGISRLLPAADASISAFAESLLQCT